jgi:hypothetical protein
MRRSLLFFLGIPLSGCALQGGGYHSSEQYLCVAKTVVWTTTAADGEKVTGHNYEGADGKYLFAKRNGAWTARGLGDAAWEYGHCNQAGVLCEVRAPAADAGDEIYGGAISRNPQTSAFYATGIKEDPAASHVFSVAGHCTKYLATF